MTTWKRCCAAAIVLASLSIPTFAAAAPAGAMNKTITISFTATGMAKSADGQAKGFSTAVSRSIYVSSAGRLFMRHTASNGRAKRGADFDPTDTRTGKGSFQFQGNKLVGVIPYGMGARQIVATFDASFSSCTASVIEGHTAGGAIQRKAPNGVMYQITSASATSPSCSIQNGNAFAN
jgi:hypothetical protein